MGDKEIIFGDEEIRSYAFHNRSITLNALNSSFPSRYLSCPCSVHRLLDGILCGQWRIVIQGGHGSMCPLKAVIELGRQVGLEPTA